MSYKPSRRSLIKKTALALGLAMGIGASAYIAPTMAAVGEPEKEDLKFGFIKLFVVKSD